MVCVVFAHLLFCFFTFRIHPTILLVFCHAFSSSEFIQPFCCDTSRWPCPENLNKFVKEHQKTKQTPYENQDAKEDVQRPAKKNSVGVERDFEKNEMCFLSSYGRFSRPLASACDLIAFVQTRLRPLAFVCGPFFL